MFHRGCVIFVQIILQWFSTQEATSLPIFYQTDYKTQHAELGLAYGPPHAELYTAIFIFWELNWENENSSSPQQSGLQVCLLPLQEQASEILK